MKIVVVVRTRDEENDIGRFCESYKDADHIIVSDGGSVDRTVGIASSFPNVILKPFSERVELENGEWRNNDSAHANHLFAEAEKLEADWIIYDDCDCVPNYLVKRDYRKILEETDKNVVMITRFYFWEKDDYFPQLSKPGKDGKFEPSLWAWRGNMNVRTVNIPPAYTFTMTGGKDVKDFHFDSTTLDLFPPYALLHYAWDIAKAKKKYKYYVKSGLIPGFVHPILNPGYGELVGREDWMRENE